MLAVATAALTWTTPGTAFSAAPTLTAVRTIGGPGHAAHYGWGADTVPDGLPGAGNVLVSDYWNYRVTELDPQGNVVRHVVAPNLDVHQAPYDVAVNPVNGNIAVGDVDAGATVDIYDRDGRLLRQCGSAARWTYPAWLDYAPDGRLAVADSRGHKIVVIDDASCAVLFQLGPHSNTSLRASTPRGVDFAPDGTLWVANNGSRRLVQWRLDRTSATALRSLPVRGDDLRGLLVNPDNDLIYLVQAAGAAVDVYDDTGAMVDTWGGRGTSEGRFTDGGRGITRDLAGNIWVGDMPNFRTQKFSPTGTFLQTAPVGASPPPVGGYCQPEDVAVLGDGTVAGIDSFNWRVNLHQADGTPLRAFGTRLELNYPRGIVADRAENTLVVINSDAQRIDKYTPTGRRVWSVPGRGWSGAVDEADGRIYVPDPVTGSVRVVNRNGSSAGTIGSGLQTPRGIAVDPVDRTLWIANWGSGRVVHLSRTGRALGGFATGLTGLTGLEVDEETVYVSSKGVHQIRMFSKSGTAQGSFGSLGSGLGRLNAPAGLELVGDRLFVMEAGNERITELRVDR